MQVHETIRPHPRIFQRQEICEGMDIVDQHIDAAPGGDNVLHRLFGVFAVAGEARERHRLAAGRTDHRGHLLQLTQSAPGYRDFRAFPGIGGRDRRADTLPRARDDRDFPIQTACCTHETLPVR